MGLLSSRQHSTKELTNKLLLRKFELEETNPVIEFLIAKDYLSNERFAESVFRTCINRGYDWLYI
ncbi:hypothetical protein [Pseudocolwellia agarivorans]|uniref:hypothetical protein n=1 Tax=Pseudocolwellia agarivorans TaxID=1911682 RepID=UPI003F881661